VLLSLGPTLAGHGLYTASLAHLPASTATLINTLEPPLTAVMAYVLLGERMGTYQLFGGFLVLAGVLAVAISDRRQRERQDAPRPSVRTAQGNRNGPDGCSPPGREGASGTRRTGSDA
jgi:hypothetical protein